ncbi:MAG: tRNA (adenosine(37)-N6)-threonylcarbamoyltransferase complex ATPase subunit type 1 TsaE [Bacteroidota bacterium]|nr:tRNA (adenosine(37)-N6)-threonylcarbamoyltransferase complex ATPase subunit type 1 TsaE [Bacteroidota bacterium]
MEAQKNLISYSPEETILFGEDFAKTLKRNDIIGLFGNLGSGKTQFVKGICKYFNVKDVINSPTFIIVNEYTGVDNNSGETFNLNHFDLYRLKNLNELIEIGIESYTNNSSVCLIEWAELADEYFKGNLKKVFFDYGKDDNERVIRFKSF